MSEPTPLWRPISLITALIATALWLVVGVVIDLCRKYAGTPSTMS